MNTTSIPEGVIIEADHHEQVMQLFIGVPLGPQSFDVSVRLELNRKRDIEVTTSLTGEGKFLWETWRNYFTSRLEERRHSQEKTGSEFSPVLPTSGSISQGLVSAAMVACGTGPRMKVWPG